jgi:zinc/manganese transport system substrate-binding protein
MKTFLSLLGLSALLTWTGTALSAVNIFACEPEWGALASEVGGDRVSVYTATTGLQDPHKIQARPSLIARARGADLVVCSGAELEVGWMPVVIGQSGNNKISVGSQEIWRPRITFRCRKFPRCWTGRSEMCIREATLTSSGALKTSSW